MSEVLHYVPPGAVQEFNPARTREKLARLEGEIITARQLKDWPKLEEAAQEKVAEIAKFVDNWNAKVVPVNQSHFTGGAITGTKSVGEAKAEWHISQQTVSRWREALRDKDAFLKRIILGAHRKALLEPEENHRAEGTGENEWHTPAEYIKAARKVMGGIDLDPATSEAAQQTVQAAQSYTKQDNGLWLPWHGRVWLNPPYERSLIGPFVAKLVDEFSSGAVEQAIMLTHNYTDTAWFHQAMAKAALLCFTRGRIGFVGIDGRVCEPTQGQTFFYFGRNGEAFREVFSEIGTVMCHACLAGR